MCQRLPLRSTNWLACKLSGNSKVANITGTIWASLLQVNSVGIMANQSFWCRFLWDKFLQRKSRITHWSPRA